MVIQRTESSRLIQINNKSKRILEIFTDEGFVYYHKLQKYPL